MRESVWVCGAGGALQASKPEVAMQPSHQNSPNSVCLSVYVCSCVPLCGKMCCGFAVRETRKHAGYCIPFRSLTGKRNDAYVDDGRTVRCDWKLPAYKSQTVKIIKKKRVPRASAEKRKRSNRKYGGVCVCVVKNRGNQNSSSNTWSNFINESPP